MQFPKIFIHVLAPSKGKARTDSNSVRSTERKSPLLSTETKTKENPSGPKAANSKVSPKETISVEAESGVVDSNEEALWEWEEDETTRATSR